MINNILSPTNQIISNLNFVDNPWFTVNQRGQSEYGNLSDTGHLYTFDRWFLTNGFVLSCSKNSDGSINISSTTGNYFAQFIEEPSRLLGKTVTLSVNHNGTIKSETATLPSEFPSEYTNYVVINLSQYCDLFLRLYPNGTIRLGIGDYTNSTNAWSVNNIRAVKLEQGAVSTLANDVAPDYATELVKCQRYLYVVNGVYKCTICDGTHGCFFQINLPVKMRTTPSLVLPNSFVVSTGVTNSTITTFVKWQYSRGTNDGLVQVNLKDTSGNKYSLDYCLDCSNNPIYISAEI